MTAPAPEMVRTLQASVRRLEAQAELALVLAQHIRDGRCNKDARNQLLVLSGECVSAMREEEKAVALQRGEAA
ncbi:hypothetical protein AA0472_1489 [Acetobacter estunensis NRIC 0472]|uniref:Uncharacterized protein n=1 Tax=Acetobacter estunensis TaxID=104097 RepID=A0A967ECB3_9PROT|nr:hypothetical protein [Acetobacter estunensis]NHO53076.1 hypothetical protein [Acetobacter estunensis]GBQ24640.1 hypothetical protein AA0472_1489 [Acetobacter estunensis NRIC 0472]